MTTPFDDVLELVTEALPAVEWHWEPVPSGHAVVLSTETGEGVIIHNYYGPHDPRPLVCPKHGVQRFDYNAVKDKFICKLCKR